MDYITRLRSLREQLAALRLDALLVTHLPNVRYLSGFTGSAGLLLVTLRGSTFFTDGRYREQAAEEVKGARTVVSRGATLAAASKALARMNRTSLGVESDHMTLTTRAQLKSLLPSGIRVRESSGVVEQLRLTKDADEVSRIRDAVVLGSSLLTNALDTLRPGIAESAVAAEIEYAARKAGAEGMSFETIVAAGVRSALPHGVASQHPIPAKGFVVLDFGVILAGYCSDMTRTVHVGKAGTEDRRVYAAVLEAQKAAIAAVAPGVELGRVDHAARSVLRKAKLDRYFSHSTGHGVGLEIHEMPRVARGQKQLLRPGMVITIEPGVYISGRGGVRIEDVVVVADRGCEVLTPAPKDLIEV